MSAWNRKKQPSQILKSCFFSDSFELYEIIIKKLMSAIFNPCDLTQIRGIVKLSTAIK